MRRRAAAYTTHARRRPSERGRWQQQAAGDRQHEAWTDEETDTASGRFYSGTLATLDRAWMRPRHKGYMAFQEEASTRLNAALKDRQFSKALDDLDAMFVASF